MAAGAAKRVSNATRVSERYRSTARFVDGMDHPWGGACPYRVVRFQS